MTLPCRTALSHSLTICREATDVLAGYDNSEPDIYANDGDANRTVANMVIVLASQDWRSGNSFWKEQVEDNTLLLYDSGQADLNNWVRVLSTYSQDHQQTLTSRV